MTHFPDIADASRDLIAAIRLPAFDVCWAGPTLGGQGFSFGSEDGKFLLTDHEGRPQDMPQPATDSGEAISGIAFLNGRMAVSTRQEILFFTLPAIPGGPIEYAKLPFGAHDVVSGVSGCFFAPLGLTGILSCLPGDGEVQEVTVSGGPSNGVYFYRVISLAAPGGGELLVSATRSGGIAAMEFTRVDGKQPLRTLSFGGLDVVDICPLLPGQTSAAAGALGKDGTVILFRDVLDECNPTTVKYESVKGVAYRLLSANGNLFLLTSRGLHVISGLVEHVLTGNRSHPVTPVLVVPFESVDMNLVANRWILIVMPDCVLRFDVSLLEDCKPADLTAGERRGVVLGQVRGEAPVYTNPPWTSRSLRQDRQTVSV